MNHLLSESSLNEFNLKNLRKDFAILHQSVNGKPLVYLDNAATTQKPCSVLEAMTSFSQTANANIHRGVHTLSVKATTAYESARQLIAKFINAKQDHEIIFTSGTTEAINLVAQSFSRSHLKAGDEIILSEMEHHSNIVPWQLISQQMGVVIKVIPITDSGELDLEALVKLINQHTKMIAISHVSNAIGTINPIKTIIELAHRRQIPVLIDGAQAVPHLAVDVQDLDCDFYVFSGHKMYGPTGTGVLYGKTAWLEQMPPYQGGGDMISQVSFEKTEFNKLPYKFEAGTPNISGVVGLAAAVEYLSSIGLMQVKQYETALLNYATARLNTIDGLTIIGNAEHKAAVISFLIDDIHPHDIGTVLDHEGIAIRAGHHCAMPLMTRYKVPATARASFGIYNTLEEIDCLVEAIINLKRLFA